MDTILLVPGYNEPQETYDPILDILRSRFREVIYVPIAWKGTLDNWVEQVQQVYSKHNPPETVLAGHSWGAMAASVVAAKNEKKPPAGLLLLSLSPYYGEDLPELPEQYLSDVSEERIAAFERCKFAEIGPKIKSPTTLVVGSEEPAPLQRRVRMAREIIKHARIVEAPGAPHDAKHEKYQEALRELI